MNIQSHLYGWMLDLESKIQCLRILVSMYAVSRVLDKMFNKVKISTFVWVVSIVKYKESQPSRAAQLFFLEENFCFLFKTSWA